MGLFDSHAHYYDRRFDDPTQGENADAVLARLFSPEGGIDGIINVGTRLETSRLCIAQAARYERMYAAVGLHPEDCIEMSDPDGELSTLREMLCDGQRRKRDKIVAIGEIGLDYYDRGIPLNKPLQMRVFEEQLALARTLSMPVIIHDRDAHGDCFVTVLRYPEVRGVFHSYSGSAEMAKELVRRGWYISFSGVVTFKNAERVRRVAETIPQDRLLAETDCPYLAPHPNRGKINRSDYMRYTLHTLAELFGMSDDEMIQLTRRNAERLFFSGVC